MTWTECLRDCSRKTGESERATSCKRFGPRFRRPIDAEGAVEALWYKAYVPFSVRMAIDDNT
jgi:hypothetical protein